MDNGKRPYEEIYAHEGGYTPEVKRQSGIAWWALIALSPFAYLFLGLAFGFWAWAWVIIPASAIILTPMGSKGFGIKLVALSPFIYVMLGMFFGFWAWAWVIIPISGILFPAIRCRGEERTI